MMESFETYRSYLFTIAQAQTYAQLPSRSSLVRAITGLGAPFEAALPAIVGFLAARFGLLPCLTSKSGSSQPASHHVSFGVRSGRCQLRADSAIQSPHLERDLV